MNMDLFSCSAKVVRVVPNAPGSDRVQDELWDSASKRVEDNPLHLILNLLLARAGAYA